MIPASCIPFIAALSKFATFSGILRKTEPLLQDYPGLLFTSRTGARFQLIPNAFNSFPVASPTL